MQLSEDGNYMWYGDEWVPVEKTVDAAPAAPVEVQAPAQPMAVEATPNMGAPVVINTPISGDKPAVNIAAALSVFKYGFIALGGWIVSMILLGIVWGLAFWMAFDSGGTAGMIIIVIATLVTIIAYGQMIIYPVGKALKDGRSDDVSFSYVDSWKTSIAGFIESIAVTIALALTIGLGIGYEITALSFLGGLGYIFFLMGYVPYMVRKAAEIMN